MGFVQYRAYYVHSDKEVEICKFWTDENNDIDGENMPSNWEINRLLQAMMFHDVHIESTGLIEDES